MEFIAPASPREQGAIPLPPSPTGDIADELGRYDEHMNKARGLSTGTRSGRLRIVQRLLLHKFANPALMIDHLQPGDIGQFIAQQLELVCTTSNARIPLMSLPATRFCVTRCLHLRRRIFE